MTSGAVNLRRSARARVTGTALFCVLLVGSAAASRDLKESHKSEKVELEPCMTMEMALKGLEQGDFTSYELTKMFVDRISEYEEEYNAFTTLNKDPLFDARLSDAKRARGDCLGKLEGIPVVIKEAVDVLGYPSTIGWTALSEETGGVELFPMDNAVVVQHILDEGAIILGKTNIPAFSLSASNADSSWAGPTINAINKELLPGGSSAGTATAVAGCLAMWGVGEETGGSIQNPAAAQSLVGIKTTYGLVSLGGVAPLAAQARDVLGPIAKTVKDAALALDVMANVGTSSFRAEGYAPPGGYSAFIGKEGYSLKGKRIGLYGKAFDGTKLEPEIKKLYKQAVDTVETLGAELVKKPFKGTNLTELPQAPRGYDSLAFDVYNYVRGLGIEGLDEFEKVVGKSPFDEEEPLGVFLNPELEGYLKNPSEFPDTSSFLKVKYEISNVINYVMDKLELDAFFYPHMGYPLPEATGDTFINAITTYEINILGGALVTVPGPTAKVEDGKDPVPFSVLFWGREFSEARLIALAYDYEQATHHRLLPPF